MTTKENILAYVNDMKKVYDEQEPIYVIMMMSKPGTEEIVWHRNGEDKPSQLPDTGAEDRVGFYYELDTAIKAVQENWCDIQDRAYCAAFILCHFPGLYSSTTPNARMYFLWDPSSETFKQTEEPVLFEHIAL